MTPKIEDQNHDLESYKAPIEAILMVAEEPVQVTALAQTISMTEVDVEKTLRSLQREYQGDGNNQLSRTHGFELREVAGGWRIYSSPMYADVVRDFVTEDRSSQLSQAALETLTIVAYKQPVTRAQVAAVRAVNVDAVMRTLVLRNLVEETGQTSPTGASFYRTTSYFLEKLGLDSLEELPKIAPLLPDNDEIEEEY